MAFPAVVDTNVLVSGLLTTSPDSPLAAVVDGMLAGRFPFLLSPQLLAEYREVLQRPTIRNLRGLSEGEVEDLLIAITTNGIWHEPSPAAGVPGAPDPGDDHLWALLRTARGAMLVSGDRLLLENPPGFASVVSPRSFVRLLKD